MNWTKNKATLEDVARVARMHRTDGAAARALGVAPATFRSLCEKHDVETPHQRKIRLKVE